MNFDKYTDRSKGFIQSAQGLALREGQSAINEIRKGRTADSASAEQAMTR
jgi:hypothetical protein